MEHAVGGYLVILFFLTVWFLPQKLAKLTVKIVRRLKPDAWHNKTMEKYKRDYQQISLLWTALVFTAAMWCGYLYAYPFLMSLLE